MADCWHGLQDTVCETYTIPLRVSAIDLNSVQWGGWPSPSCMIVSQGYEVLIFFFFLWHNGLIRARVSSSMRFLHHTQRRITVGRNPLDEWSARRRDLYLTTHNTHNRKTSMPPVGFEPTISAGERPQIYALDRTATGTGFFLLCWPAMYSYALCTGICKKKIMSCHVWNYTVLMRILWNL